VARAIKQMADLWKPHQHQGITRRHEMGRLINRLIGPPTCRQKYGLGVTKRLSEELHISRPEISRLRKFAHHVVDLEEFLRDHGDLNSWTKIKQYLPTFPSNRKPPSAGQRLAKSVKSLANRFRALGEGLAADDRRRVLKVWGTLQDLASELLAVNVRSEKPDAMAGSASEQNGKAAAEVARPSRAISGSSSRVSGDWLPFPPNLVLAFLNQDFTGNLCQHRRTKIARDISAEYDLNRVSGGPHLGLRLT
jgi:hypothetical protein